MSRAVVLDAGPLGLATSPSKSLETEACAEWLRSLIAGGVRVLLPEVADYEVRRELLRAGKLSGLARLDAFGRSLEYLPLTTAAMRRAAELWAEARRKGLPTADRHALDGDVILAAQALTLGIEVVVATTNLGHLARFVAAAEWADIQ